MIIGPAPHASCNKGKPEEFHVRIAKESEEIKDFLEVGFEYVCKKDRLLFFRKRK